MASVRITNGPGGGGDGHTLNAFDIAGREVCVMDYQRLRDLTSEANARGQRQVNLRGAHIREPVDGKGRLMRDHADDLRPTDLRPEDGGHVVPELRHGEASEPIHAARDALDVSLLGELHQTDLMQACRSRLRRSEVAAWDGGAIATYQRSGR